MNINKTSTFGKVEILLKDVNSSVSIASVTKIEFYNCGLMITGDYIVVVIDEKDDINNNLTSTGRIFNLKDVSAYKTHAI
jgi:hypothetical protein